MGDPGQTSCAGMVAASQQILTRMCDPEQTFSPGPFAVRQQSLTRMSDPVIGTKVSGKKVSEKVSVLARKKSIRKKVSVLSKCGSDVTMISITK